jgi:NTP pyrophosphatase (non-canonical NTP hydrolase)
MSDINNTQNASLSAYQQYVQQVMQERGFDDETVSQKFMLLLEEAGGFAQAARREANLKARADRMPSDTLADDAADVFTILLDLCNQLGINLEEAFTQKEQKNKTRSWE